MNKEGAEGEKDDAVESPKKAEKAEEAKAESKPEAEKEEEEDEEEEDLNFSGLPEYKFEMDRHRIIVAMIISDFFLFMLKQFKRNHVV